MKLKTQLKYFLAISLTIIGLHSQSQKIKSKKIVKILEKVSDWQIEHFRDTFNLKTNKPHHIADWTNAALYVGMERWAELSESDKYFEWLKSVGEQQDWKLHWRKYMADDLAVGQMYIELYREYGDEKMIEPTLRHFNWLKENPSTQPITLDNYKHIERWTWCDALFMAPPVWAKLHSITGDKSYTEWMLEEYRATTQHLFDTVENLYYRDNSYIGKLDKGHKIFWSRGNGWVFGGLCLLMEEYEKGSAPYNYFLSIYEKMAPTIKELQTPKGHWAMSLLGADHYPTPETSGTSFFTFALAWGINNGILDREVYEPVVNKAWNALIKYVSKEGMLGYVQPIGAAPGNAWLDRTEVYGTGAFLATGSELHKLYCSKK